MRPLSVAEVRTEAQPGNRFSRDRQGISNPHPLERTKTSSSYLLTYTLFFSPLSILWRSIIFLPPPLPSMIVCQISLLTHFRARGLQLTLRDRSLRPRGGAVLQTIRMEQLESNRPLTQTPREYLEGDQTGKEKLADLY
ncbi:hypothetical protein TNCV_4523061 [Trichonephila clavipes]|nr:hypothetical protein TNCV_4523061 [Trichonephila clavipes]